MNDDEWYASRLGFVCSLNNSVPIQDERLEEVMMECFAWYCKLSTIKLHLFYLPVVCVESFTPLKFYSKLSRKQITLCFQPFTQAGHSVLPTFHASRSLSASILSRN